MAAVILAAVVLMLLSFSSAVIKATEQGRRQAMAAARAALIDRSLRVAVGRVQPPFWHLAFSLAEGGAGCKLNYLDGLADNELALAKTADGFQLRLGDDNLDFGSCLLGRIEPIIEGGKLLGLAVGYEIAAEEFVTRALFASFSLRSFDAPE
ncbi:MAG: hypothetical protein A2087_08060 [Spirochaetes bacterium GWD1_61_31]|nr:MAG: hypothetical protein A2087_08060 [Spirochaetes bacterium GWD1_61_31]OHD43940.1 MAG: hypothetical protein A2Y35_08715 [Spirochaetes bacterium GWE1_60_18]HAP42659.1 hypothetical protein [Spirochaetaceae bacterium]HAW85482.1 hypothetical protein [Spirochaetaceae bacterium]HAX37572.1 hypothetical protein [Spirochaetaceae bacterium]